MEDFLNGQTAVVTGGASSIGRTIALSFANYGADVVVADLQAEPRGDGEVSTHELIPEEFGTSATFVECDASDPDDLDAAVAAADEFGGVDVMVNNAGVIEKRDFLDVTYEQYREIMDVNAAGVFFGAQAAARRMVESDGGRIINMSSIAGIRGRERQITYCASKGAVRLMTYAMADELREDGIRVNAIHPGTIETPMTTRDIDLSDMEGDTLAEAVPYPVGEPHNIADCALFLTSDWAEFINGASIVVDGGRINIY